MARILMVYDSTYGQTEKIVRRIDQELARRGHEVSVYKGDQLPPELGLGKQDAIIVAGSVIAGKHQRSITEFVRRFAGVLNVAPSAFISVSGAAANEPERAREMAESFLSQTSWRPPTIRCFAGALAYTKYPWWLLWIMKRISRSQGGPTDTSRDHELTDWKAVDQLPGNSLDFGSRGWLDVRRGGRPGRAMGCTAGCFRDGTPRLPRPEASHPERREPP